MKQNYKKIIGLCILMALGIISLYYANMPQIEDKGNWVKLQESQKINGYLKIGKNIYGGDFDSCSLKYIDPLYGVDAGSFEVCINSGYARDKNHVYYPILETYREAETWGASRYDEYVVQGASPKSFKFIGDCYGIDGYTMYRMGEKVKWDDAVFNHYKKHDHMVDTTCHLCKTEMLLKKINEAEEVWKKRKQE